MFLRFKSLCIFILFLSLSGPAFAVTVDFSSAKNPLVKERGDFCGGGRQGARVPFVKSKVVTDPDRGDVLEMNFNVSQGYGGTYFIFRPNQLPKQFNQVSFWLRGTSASFKVELKDESIHTFIVERDDRSHWRQVVIGLNDFSNADTLKTDQVKEFVFVFEDHRTSPRLGKIDMDDLTFSTGRLKNQSASQAVPGPVSVKGTSPVTLSSKISEPGSFQTFRFEASWDNRHWFLISEFTDQSKQEFEATWNTNRYPGGTYYLRAVTVDSAGNRKESLPTQLKLRDSFNVDQFLDQVQKASFDYFVNEVDPWSYLVKDRTSEGSVFSSGLSGFQLTAYVIGVERGWMTRAEALKRMNRILDFLLNELNRYDGLIPHWVRGRSEVWELGMGDIVETSFILAGSLTAQQYFDQNTPDEVSFRSKVDRLYREIKWNLFIKRLKPEDETGILPWHWTKQGPSKLNVTGYNEAMFVYLLGLGAPAYALPEKSWTAWSSSYQTGKYGPYQLIACAPLFTHQYSHLWFDFRNIRDAHADYFENSVTATLVNREFSLKENKYAPEIWGLTASEGPNHYKAYGAPPDASNVPVVNDGTIAPTAAATSIMFTPPLSIAAMKHMYDEYHEKLWGPYGFKDAFNPRMKWYSDVYLGLDQGPIVIGIENYRTGLVWKLFMKNPYVQEGLTRAGFKPEKVS